MVFWLMLAIHLSFLLFLLKGDESSDDRIPLFEKQPWTSLDVIIVVAMNAGFLAGLLLLRKNFPALHFFLSRNRSAVGAFFFLCLLTFIKCRHQRIAVLGCERKAYTNALVLLTCLGSLALFVITAVPGFTLIVRNVMVSVGLIEESVPRPQFLSGLASVDRGFYVIIVAPVMEETLFRGIAYTPFRRKYGPKKAIVVNSLLFFSSHLNFNIVSLFLGLLLSWLYEKKQSFMAAVAAHALFNCIAFGIGVLGRALLGQAGHW